MLVKKSKSSNAEKEEERKGDKKSTLVADNSSNKVQKKKKGLRLIEIRVNNRMGICTHIKCTPKDTVGDVLKLIAAQTGTNHEKIQLKLWHRILNPLVTLEDYEIKHGSSVDLYHK
ncbi:MAG: ubiquitin-like modifier hub1 [Marteilia pararefringens]